MEADGPVDAERTAPTSPFENPGTDSGFQQLPQRTEPRSPDESLILLSIPSKVFYSKGTGNLSRWVKRELYRLSREAGLCWTCRDPGTGGRPFCPKHREKATKVQRAGVKRRRKAEKVAEAQKKIATPANLADAIGAFRELQQLKRRG